MATLRKAHAATNGPGDDPRWARSDKDGVGTAYSLSSTLWYTVSRGIINEVYYPTIDTPQIRDLQYLITDGSTFFHEERRDLFTKTSLLTSDSLSYKVENSTTNPNYAIVKTILSDPISPCLLIHTELSGDATLLPNLRLYALLAPHIDRQGRGNNGYVAEVFGGQVLVANRNSTWLAMKATVPFAKCSCGYVGVNDGWQDLNAHRSLTFEFDHALDGNIALTGQLDLSQTRSFVLGVAFGDTLNSALVRLFNGLGRPFGHNSAGPAAYNHVAAFEGQWKRGNGLAVISPNPGVTGDQDQLYLLSQKVLAAHEDKVYDGALIASLSIPWGEHASDGNHGYHLVWTRDMCNSATGLLAAGDTETPLRALMYLSCTQLADGGFYQNFQVNGIPYWTGVQLDEIAFPIMLAWRLHSLNGLENFDPYPMVCRAAAALTVLGPITPQERWEENAGFSPSTLASNIAALVCASCFARQRNDPALAGYYLEFADFLEAHIETWTVTNAGTLLTGTPRHYIRILPPGGEENPDTAWIEIRNNGGWWPARDVVDAGFLELVRYGIRKADAPLIEDSLRVVDHVLKHDFPNRGPCWYRYNHDGYGNQSNGGPFQGQGEGGPWPLLTGERGHYELARGNDAKPYLHAMERFSHGVGLLPEQVWPRPDIAGAHMFYGRPTGGAMPLAWAHAEYIKLARSISAGEVIDLIPEVANRYRDNQAPGSQLEIWNLSRRVSRVAVGKTIRFIMAAPFRIRWSLDDWQHFQDTPSTATPVATHYVDILAGNPSTLKFTFYWTDSNSWQGQDFEVSIN